MKNFILSAFCILTLASCANTGDETRAIIETSHGPILVKLYNETPRHRDNFIKLAKENFYDSLLFHRVMDDFMIQGGDPDSRNAAPDRNLGGGGPGYLIEHEIGAPHLKGTLAAARTQNPQKKSSGSQFYIVEGKIQTDADLNAVEKRKGIKYNATQRELYKTIGGAAFLDQDYTVFGEIIDEDNSFSGKIQRILSGRDAAPIKSTEVLESIASVPVGKSNRPKEDVKMAVRILE